MQGLENGVPLVEAPIDMTQAAGSGFFWSPSQSIREGLALEWGLALHPVFDRGGVFPPAAHHGMTVAVRSRFAMELTEGMLLGGGSDVYVIEEVEFDIAAGAAMKSKLGIMTAVISRR